MLPGGGVKAGERRRDILGLQLESSGQLEAGAWLRGGCEGRSIGEGHNDDGLHRKSKLRAFGTIKQHNESMTAV